MRRIFQYEWNRFWRSGSRRAVWCCGLVLVFAHAVMFWFQNRQFAGVDPYPFTVHDSWIGIDFQLVFHSVLYYFFPLFASLPYSDSYIRDRQSGYLKELFLFTKRKHFALARFSMVFFSGALSVGMILCGSYLLCATFLPSIPENIAGRVILTGDVLFAELFYSHAFLYNMLYIGINMCFAGMLACVGLAFSTITENRFNVCVFPLVLYLLNWVLFDSLEQSRWTIYRMIDVSQSLPGNRISCMILVWCVAMLASFALFAASVAKRDVL